MKTFTKRTQRRLTLGAIFTITVLVLAGCGGGSVSRQEVTREFFTYINNDYDAASIRTLLDSSAAFANSADADYWKARIPDANAPYNVTSTTESGSNVTAQVTDSATTPTNLSYRFEFTEEGSDGLFSSVSYRIRRIVDITVTPSTIFE